jgi:hypothetical protein
VAQLENDHGATIMSLSDLASLGSFISGFAVVISLVFLYFQVRQINAQVRQADRNQQASIRHSRVTRVVDIQLAQANPAAADAWRHAAQNPNEITQTEVSQFLALSRALFMHLEDSFYQHEDGLLPEQAFATMVAGARLVATSPGYRVAWKAARRNHPGQFGDFMDGVVARASQEPPNVTPTVDEWRAAFAEETAGA